MKPSLICPFCSSDELLLVDLSSLDHRPLRQCQACGARLGPRPRVLSVLYLLIMLLAFSGSLFMGAYLIRMYTAGLIQPRGIGLPIGAAVLFFGLFAAPYALY